MRARRRQIIFDVLSPTTTLDTYGQAQRTYAVTLRIAGVYRTGSSSKAEYAEAQQGIQTNTIETRYVRGYTFTLDQLIKEVGAVMVAYCTLSVAFIGKLAQRQ